MRLQQALCIIVFLFCTAFLAAEDKESKWIMLFDGKSLKNWQRYDGKPIQRGWVVEDGALFLKTKGGGTIITKEAYSDFELELEWKIAPGGNSGIMYRVRKGDPAAYYSGPEYQLLDDAKHRDGKDPKTSAASLYALVAPKNKKLKPVGEYNKTKIVLKGNHLEHWLNGKKVLEIEMNGKRWNRLVQGSKFKDWKQFGKSRQGHIALQDHGDKVWFRNIRIRRLSKNK